MNSPSLVHVVDDDAQVRDSLAWLLDSVGIPSRTWADGAGFLGACHTGMSGSSSPSESHVNPTLKPEK